MVALFQIWKLAVVAIQKSDVFSVMKKKKKKRAKKEKS